MKPVEFRRILIVKLSALGDVAHALPVLDYLRKAAPDALIDWAVDRRFAALLEGNEALYRVVSLDVRRWKKEWTAESARKEAAGAIRQLRREKYDIAFDIQGNAKSGIITGLSNAPLRFGFDRRGVREAPNLLFTNRKVASLPEDGHVTRKMLRVASAPFGGTFDMSSLRAEIPLTDDEVLRAERLLRSVFPKGEPLIAIHHGTTWGTKRMDPEFWGETVAALRRIYPKIGVFLSWGNEEERREAEAIQKISGGSAALLPRLSLKELAAAYRKCGFFIGPDTGPLHIAAAVGCRTVSVFRVTDGNRNAPHGAGHRFLQARMPCAACLRKRCARDAECRQSISPDAAADMMAELAGRAE